MKKLAKKTVEKTFSTKKGAVVATKSHHHHHHGNNSGGYGSCGSCGW